MKKYKLNKGEYREGGVRYTAGHIVATDVAVVTLFGDKFTEVSSSTKASKGEPEFASDKSMQPLPPPVAPAKLRL